MLHPQTIAAAVLAIVAALNGSDALDAQPARRVRPPRGQQYDFWFGTSKLSELKFQKKFRLSRDALVDLTVGPITGHFRTPEIGPTARMWRQWAIPHRLPGLWGAERARIPLKLQRGYQASCALGSRCSRL